MVQRRIVLIAAVGLLAAGCTSGAIKSNEPLASPSATFPTAMATPSSCQENNGLPDPNCTPGALNPHVNQSNILTTICASGWTSTVRPSTSYTEPLKLAQIKQYGYTDQSPSSYEEDHLISLELGGSPTSPLNLWPEPHANPYGSFEKDQTENYLRRQVCDGNMTLNDAQYEIAHNWENEYAAMNGGSK